MSERVCCLFWLPKVIQEYLIKKFLDEVDSLLLRRTCRHFRELIPIPSMTSTTMYYAMDDACENNNVVLFDYLLGIYMTITQMEKAFCGNDNEYTLREICRQDSVNMVRSLQKHTNNDLCLCMWDLVRDMKFKGNIWKYMEPVMLSSFETKNICLESLLGVDDEEYEYDRDLKAEWLFRNGINVGYFERLCDKTKIKRLLRVFPEHMKRHFNISAKGWKDYEKRKRKIQDCLPELFQIETRIGYQSKLIKRNI